MVDTTNINDLSSPIPGQSLTAELGASSWQQPPKYNTVDEALEFYSPKLLDEGFQDQMFDVNGGITHYRCRHAYTTCTGRDDGISC